MRCARFFLGLLLATAGPLAALPAFEEKASVELDVDRTAYAPGEAGRLVALVRIEDGWHVNSHQPTYEYLIPTTVEVALPKGWEAPRLTYPQPEIARFTFAEEPLSVFQGEVPVVAAFRVPPAQSAGEVPLLVTVTYQACNDTQCLPPVRHEQKAALRIGGGGEAKDHGYFARETGAAASAAAVGGGAGGGGTGVPAGGHPAKAEGEAASGAAEGPRAAAELETAAAPLTPAAARALGANGAKVRSLPWMLALALLGGLILNAMPCVLPVLSIKVFSLVKHANLGRREVATAGIATTFGILASFWALAAAAVLARRAGAAVGWGLHFQQPAFVALLAVVVVLFSLNLWGIFEIQLPGRLATAAGGGRREGIAGHFVTGLFATLMATPCSAPFLGTAVGFALGEPTAVVFAVFTAVGLGMAAPYLLLAAWPAAARLLPKPGTWRVRLKEVMGFLLAGAAIWLFYVLAQQVSAASLALVQLGLLLLALVVWLGRAARPGLQRAAAVTAVLAVAGGTVWAAAAAPPARRSVLAEPARGLIAWQPFERARAEQLAAAGT
ncbi:MAG TPA: protein-disulfide reductase DsbD domain-containing protein, partial [Thermoanaerobaculia bacterium]|nr:protein-disulfide reductase DsbD domain-containing protein [Thermoanaerobaculia bacterium]